MKMPAIGRLAHIVLLRKSSKDGTPMTNGGDRTDTEKPILWPACHRRSRTECNCLQNSPHKRSPHKREPQKTSLARSPVVIENDIQRDKAAQRSLMSGFSSTHRR